MKKGQKPNLYCIKGGVGKHLQFTPLLKPLFEKHHQKLLINSAYPEIFKSCPEVADSQYSFVEVFKGGNYFNKYDNLFFHDPYESNFLKENKRVFLTQSSRPTDRLTQRGLCMLRSLILCTV